MEKMETGRRGVKNGHREGGDGKCCEERGGERMEGKREGRKRKVRIQRKAKLN